jgi:hypothetical protein
MMELYLYSPIYLHGIVLELIKHRDNFTFKCRLIVKYKDYRTKCHTGPQTWTNSLERTKLKETGRGTWHMERKESV